MPIDRYYYIIELARDLVQLLPEDNREIRRFAGVWFIEPVEDYDEYYSKQGIMKCIPFEWDIERLEQEYNAH